MMTLAKLTNLEERVLAMLTEQVEQGDTAAAAVVLCHVRRTKKAISDWQDSQKRTELASKAFKKGGEA